MKGDLMFTKKEIIALAIVGAEFVVAAGVTFVAQKEINKRFEKLMMTRNAEMAKKNDSDSETEN